jgi:sarcosine oxidase subunit gamma
VTVGLTEISFSAQVSVRGEAQPGFPVEPNTWTEISGRTVLWQGPDEWLVLEGREEDYPASGAAVDVSANRICFELAGPDAEEVLSAGCSLDLDASVFPSGRCAQTLLARAQVVLVRLESERWLILVRPSFAPYLREWLADAAS